MSVESSASSARSAQASPARSAPLFTLLTLREAIRGSPVDYTTAPVGRAILMLAVPMVMEMAMESIFVLADVFWVAHLGFEAVATVGLTESMESLVYTAAMGVSIGATALVARRIGERDAEEASRAAGQSILIGLVISAAIGAFGWWWAPRLLAAMGASPGVVANGSGFTRVMLGGNATVFLLFLMNAVFRGAGDAAIAMRVLWLGNAINIVLGPLLIFGPGPFPALGVTGAAVATNIGRGTAVVYQAVTLFAGRGRIRLDWRHLRPDPAGLRSVLRLSGSGTIQILLGTSSYIALVRILAGFGSVALAGYTVGMRVIVFALLPSFGISNAAATMVGQNLGANSPDRAEQAVWKAARYNMVFLGLVGGLFLAGAPAIVAVFTPDAAVRGFAAATLRVISLGFVFYACGMVLTQSFNGAGDTWTPTLINVAVFWLWEIPLAWVLSRYPDLGAYGVVVALTMAYSLLAVVSAVVFRRGRWKQTRV